MTNHILKNVVKIYFSPLESEKIADRIAEQAENLFNKARKSLPFWKKFCWLQFDKGDAENPCTKEKGILIPLDFIFF